MAVTLGAPAGDMSLGCVSVLATCASWIQLPGHLILLQRTLRSRGDAPIRTPLPPELT